MFNKYRKSQINVHKLRETAKKKVYNEIKIKSKPKKHNKQAIDLINYVYVEKVWPVAELLLL